MRQSARSVMILVLCGGAFMAATTGLVARQASAPPAKDEQALPSLTGVWALSVNMAMGTSTPRLTLKQDGEKLSGAYAGRYGSFPIEGTLKRRAIDFWFTMTVESEKVEMSFTGDVAPDGQAMRGSADLGQAGDGTWTATRAKDK
jgi:hypothetical protein